MSGGGQAPAGRADGYFTGQKNMMYKGIGVRTLSELRDPRGSCAGKNRVVRMPDELWELIGLEARRAATSTSELIRAVMSEWVARELDAGGCGLMDENAYMTDLSRAKYFQRADEKNSPYWMGYILGLHRAHDGENFQVAHEALMSSDEPIGIGYRAGIYAYRSGEPGAHPDEEQRL